MFIFEILLINYFIATFIVIFKLILSGFYIIPFVSDLSYKKKRINTLPYGIKLNYKLLWFTRYLRGDWSYNVEKEHKLYYEALQYLKKNGEQQHNYLDIDIVSPDIDPKIFYNKYIKTPKPVVIRGLGKKLDIHKLWSWII